jgi:hypothetical protein
VSYALAEELSIVARWDDHQISRSQRVICKYICQRTRGGADGCFPADVLATEVRLEHSLPAGAAQCKVVTSNGV